MSIKNFLPYGIINYLSPYYILRLLGLSQWEALPLALSRESARHLRFTRLDMLPRNTIHSLQYIVDVGANWGDWSIGVLSFIKPKKLIAIEPSPIVLSKLKNRLSSYPNTELLNLAVGDKPGTAELNIAVHSHNTSLLEPKSQEMNELSGGSYWNVKDKVTVTVDTLDNILADLPEISLLKIDVQGYEKQVLEGSKNILKKTKYVILEVTFIPHYEGDTLFAELNNIMNELGFSLTNLKVCHPGNSLKVTWGDAVYVANNLL